MAYIDGRNLDKAAAARQEKEKEKYALDWAALAVAAGVIKFKDSGGDDPAWEHVLPPTPSSRHDYIQILRKIIEDDPALKKQAVDAYGDTLVRSEANKALAAMGITKTRELIEELAERKKNPTREI